MLLYTCRSTHKHIHYTVFMSTNENFLTRKPQKSVSVFKSDLAEARGAGGEAMDLYRLVVVGIVLIV